MLNRGALRQVYYRMDFTQILHQMKEHFWLMGNRILISLEKETSGTLQRNPWQNKERLEPGTFGLAKEKDRVKASDYPMRRVIIATNAAETAVTFENCWAVVDTCLVNQMTHDPIARTTLQSTVQCAKSASKQRGGRAGRMIRALREDCDSNGMEQYARNRTTSATAATDISPINA